MLSKKQLLDLCETKENLLNILYVDLGVFESDKNNYKIMETQKKIINVQKTYINNLFKFVATVKEEE